MGYDWNDRPNKDVVRTSLFEFIKSKKRVLDSYLCLPGWDDVNGVGGLDILRGIEAGVITDQTKVIGFEMDGELANKITSYFEQQPNVEVRNARLEDSKLALQSLDFAFLDFTGTIDWKLYHWLEREFTPAVRGGRSFAVAIPFGRQTGRLFNEIARRFKTDLRSCARFMEKKFPAIWIDQPIIATWLFILKSAFRSRSNTIRNVLLYHDGDHVPMVVFLFDEMGRHPDNNYPELVGKFERKEGSMTKRSKAAYKAHATRRANARAKMLSARARKAWRTRRAKATV